MLARKVSDLNHHITANDGSRAAMTALQGFSVRRPSLVSAYNIWLSCNHQHILLQRSQCASGQNPCTLPAQEGSLLWRSAMLPA